MWSHQKLWVWCIKIRAQETSKFFTTLHLPRRPAPPPPLYSCHLGTSIRIRLNKIILPSCNRPLHHIHRWICRKLYLTFDRELLGRRRFSPVPKTIFSLPPPAIVATDGTLGKSLVLQRFLWVAEKEDWPLHGGWSLRNYCTGADPIRSFVPQLEKAPHVLVGGRRKPRTRRRFLGDLFRRFWWMWFNFFLENDRCGVAPCEDVKEVNRLA